MSLRPNASETRNTVDVLIVGAGPAGLMGAYALAKAGVCVRIIEKRATRVAVGHADGLQPRTMESYGLLDRVMKEGNQLRTAAFYNPNPNKPGEIQLSERVPFFKPNMLDPRYDFGVTLHQGAIEQIFLDNMQDMDLQVDRSTIPIAIEVNENSVSDPDAHPVTIKNVDSSETEVVHAKYVVGADGAHSWIRRNVQIPVDESSTPYVWGVVDLVPETDFPDFRNWAGIRSDSGSCMIIPRERDMIRIYVQLEGQNAIDATKEAADGSKVKMGPEWILDVARKTLYPFTIVPKSFEWSSIYTIAQGVASRYSVRDRVFIAGDACHTHSPKAGQGMNASINDTYNLAWKLVWVLRGWSNRTLLKTYEFERRQYALDLIAFDKKLAKLISEKTHNESNVNGAMRTAYMSMIQKSTEFSSGIGVHYLPSDIVDIKNQGLASGIVIGKRMPPGTVVRLLDFCPIHIHDLLPSDTRFKILVFAGNASSSAQRMRLQQLAVKIGNLRSLLGLDILPGNSSQSGLDVLTILSTKLELALFKELPLKLRSHWSKVYVDYIDTNPGTDHIQVYQNYGIGVDGILVVVRPDGYVGAIATIDDFEHIKHYFSSFLETPK
ncbi:FAD binding domain-containing protein [Lentinula edodes]|uniref:FAD binding domain-containing protein n=1 Tax=Lentinula edodes TaxID=5353 RepID=UPI001E8DC7E5|nr:FAD binding domain-containing protein [Lentinula edodes]KAH7870520.1 FAD binding domain-containing protein [Lentinula edodes]